LSPWFGLAQVNAEVLCIILDTLTVSVKLQPEAAVHFERNLGALLTACFLNYYADSFVTDAVVELVRCLSKVPEMVPCLEARLLSTIVSILEQYEKEELMCIVPPALDMLTAMVEVRPLHAHLCCPVSWAQPLCSHEAATHQLLLVRAIHGRTTLGRSLSDVGG
jgi:hypothetical protein